MCASLKIVNPCAENKRAEPGRNFNGPGGPQRVVKFRPVHTSGRLSHVLKAVYLLRWNIE